MRVYVSCEMTEPEGDTRAVEEVLRYLSEAGHQVLPPDLAGGLEQKTDGLESDEALAQGFAAWLAQADCMVAEVSFTPDLVIMEVLTFAYQGKPILAIARKGAQVFPFLSPLPGLTLARYESPEQAVALVRAFFKQLEQTF